MCFVFFFNDTATTEIYTLSLHDALPIWHSGCTSRGHEHGAPETLRSRLFSAAGRDCRVSGAPRSEEHTSELQSHVNLVCRLLLEKKKNIKKILQLVFRQITCLFSSSGLK